jgi:hypothetical protein
MTFLIFIYKARYELTLFQNDIKRYVNVADLAVTSLDTVIAFTVEF